MQHATHLGRKIATADFPYPEVELAGSAHREIDGNTGNFRKRPGRPGDSGVYRFMEFGVFVLYSVSCVFFW